MSIASEIQRISGCREDIKTAIAAKGVTVPETATLSSCPDLIGSIQTGGGGGGNYMYDASVVAPFTGYKTASFTATQIPVSAGDWHNVSFTYDSSSSEYTYLTLTYTMPVSALICADSIPMSSLLHFEFDTAPHRIRLYEITAKSYYNDYYATQSPSTNFSVTGLTGEGILNTGTWNALRDRINSYGEFDRWDLQDSATDPCYIIARFEIVDDNWNPLLPTATNVVNQNYTVTGTAYPYPDRPITITGNTSATCSGYCNFTRPEFHDDEFIYLAQHVFASANIEMSNGNTSAIPNRRDDTYGFYYDRDDACKNLPRWTVGDLPIVIYDIDSVAPDSVYSVSYDNENWNYSTTGYVNSSNLS
jgi:hypothetical protein